MHNVPKPKPLSTARLRMGTMRMRDGGELAQGASTPGFWGSMANGVYDAVVKPIAEDISRGHDQFKESYPLAYQVAQLHPAVGIPTSIADYGKAMAKGEQADAMSAALSAVPVMEKSYKLATSVPRSLKAAYDAALAHSAGIAARTNLATRAGAHTAAAANTVQMGTGAYEQASRNYRD